MLVSSRFLLANVAAWLRTLRGAGVRKGHVDKRGPVALASSAQVLAWAASGVVPQPRACRNWLSDAVITLLHHHHRQGDLASSHQQIRSCTC